MERIVVGVDAAGGSGPPCRSGNAPSPGCASSGSAVSTSPSPERAYASPHYRRPSAGACTTTPRAVSSCMPSTLRRTPSSAAIRPSPSCEQCGRVAHVAETLLPPPSGEHPDCGISLRTSGRARTPLFWPFPYRPPSEPSCCDPTIPCSLRMRSSKLRVTARTAASVIQRPASSSHGRPIAGQQHDQRS